MLENKKLLDQLRARPLPKMPPKDSELYEIYHYHLWPLVVQDPQSGQVAVDLERIQCELLPELQALGFQIDEMVLEVDGGQEHGGQDLPIDMKILKQPQPSFIYQGGPVHRQQYVRVVCKQNGKKIHVTDNGLLEKKEFPRVNPESYADYPEAELHLPRHYTMQTGVDPTMVRLCGEIQHRNVVFSVAKSSRNKELHQAFDKFGPKLHPQPNQDKNGRWTGWSLLIPGRPEPMVVGPSDILARGGAAFSQHSFFWDDHMVAESRANTDPDLAISTATYWLESQNADGSMAREVDYKGALYFDMYSYKFGKTEPNLGNIGAAIEGWAWHEILRWSPTATAPLLPSVVTAIRQHRQWLLSLSVRDAAGRLIGFKWSNIGARDNAPRPLDEMGMVALPKYGRPCQAAPGRDKRGLAVDLLAQYRMLLSHECELLQILGQFDEAAGVQAQAVEIDQLLNSRYYDAQLGWYVDLIPVGENDWAPVPIVTLAAFWVVAAKAAPRARVGEMIADYLENAQRFGGDFPPSVPKDNPYYDERGRYWRGGGWPPDWEMVSRAVFEYGFRAEAAALTSREMRAMATASRCYAQGETPTFMVTALQQPPGTGSEDEHLATLARVDDYRKKYWAGEMKNSKPPGVGTIFEFYGLSRDHEGHAFPTYGVTTVPEHNGIHLTRANFAGWGSMVPLRCAHYLLGLDASPRYVGASRGLDRWLKAYKSNPEFTYHRAPPGVVELAPTFDPGDGETRLSNYCYDQIRFDLSIDRKKTGEIHITVHSEKPMRMQFHQNWVGEGSAAKAVDEPVFSSSVFEIGGDKACVFLECRK